MFIASVVLVALETLVSLPHSSTVAIVVSSVTSLNSSRKPTRKYPPFWRRSLARALASEAVVAEVGVAVGADAVGPVTATFAASEAAVAAAAACLATAAAATVPVAAVPATEEPQEVATEAATAVVLPSPLTAEAVAATSLVAVTATLATAPALPPGGKFTMITDSEHLGSRITRMHRSKVPFSAYFPFALSLLFSRILRSTFHLRHSPRLRMTRAL